MKKIFIFIFVLILLALVFLYFYGYIVTHIIPIGKEFIFNVNPGDTLNSVITRLKENGLKGDKFIIKTYTRIFFNKLLLKVGTYQVTEYSTYWTILQDINKGIGIPVKITIPPGLKISEIIEIFDKNNFVKKEEFINIINQSEFLSNFNLNSFNILNEPSIISYWQKFKIDLKEKKFEGFFYPETYTYAKGVSAKIILQQPVLQFFKVLSRFPISELTPLEIYKKIIIASLIEEEAMLDEEKPIIASVIYNRLAKNMRLELCPTVEYILPIHKKKLTLDDLNIKSPYNTYINSGLPPTPICNPSFESLKAAFFPAKTEYLFYVAKGDGSHYFSKTFEEHLRYKSNSKYY